MTEKIIAQIEKEIKDVEIKVKDIQPYEWGGWFDGIEDYKKLQISINGELLQIVLSQNLANKFCEEINSIWGDDCNPTYNIDLTGFWLEFPKDWDENFYNGLYDDIFDEIKEIAIKYYLIAKYDNIVYIRKGFDIYKYLGDD